MRVIFPGPNVGVEAAAGTSHTKLGIIKPGELEVADEALAAVLVDNGFFRLPSGSAPPVGLDAPATDDTTDKPRPSRNKE